MATKRVHKKMQARTKIVMLCVIVFVVAMTIAWVRLHQRSQDLAREDAQVEKQIAQEKQRKEELKKKKEYVKSKEYIEKIAMEQFGLLHTDEYLLKAKE